MQITKTTFDTTRHHIHLECATINNELVLFGIITIFDVETSTGLEMILQTLSFLKCILIVQFESAIVAH